MEPTPIAVPVSTDQRDLWSTRIYYLLFYGGMGFMSPFLNLFFTQQGLSGTQVGTVTSLAAFITLIAAPFWAHRNAHWRNPRGAIQWFIVLTALSYLWMSQQTLFIGIALVNIFRSAVSAGIAPLSDSLAMSVTGRTRAGFGSIRVWGSLGYVIFVLISGLIAEQAGLRATLIGACVVTLTAVIILAPVAADNFVTKQHKDAPPTSLRITVRDLLHNRPMLGIAAMLTITFLGSSGVNQFEGVFLRQLGARDTVIALVGMIGAVVELPCMLWADHLTRRYGSHRLLLFAMLTMGSVRALVFVFPSIITIVVAKAMFGLPFSFYTVALIQGIVQHIAPHERRTVLALYTVTLTSLIGIIGAPIAGAAFDHFGGRWLYIISATGYALGWICLRVGGAHSQNDPAQSA